MPESMSIERRKMLAYLGAELELTPREKGMNGAIARAKELLAEHPGSVIPEPVRQPGQPGDPCAGPRPRKSGSTPPGEVDAIISGVGTGGTLTGVAQALKPRRPGLRMIAVEPAASPVLSGGKPGPHPIQGIGAGFVPEVLDTEAIDEVIQVSNEETFATCAPAGADRGHSRRHFLRRGAGGDAGGGEAAGDSGQADRDDHSVVRRTLHHHGAVRGAVRTAAPPRPSGPGTRLRLSGMAALSADSGPCDGRPSGAAVGDQL